MYRFTVGAVSLVATGVLCLLAWMLTDLHDRTFPTDLGTTHRVSVDLTDSSIPDAERLEALTTANKNGDWGLVRAIPDPQGERGGLLYVPLDPHADLPDHVRHFGSQPPGRVVDVSALANSPASGEYLVTGDVSTAAVNEWMTSVGASTRWSSDGWVDNAQILWRDLTFLVVILALVLLASAMVLLWFAATARSRGLRALAGASPSKLTAQEVQRFATWFALPSILVVGLFCAAVVLVKGVQFLPYAGAMAGGMSLGLFGCVVVAALVTAVVTRPDPRHMARRIAPVVLMRVPGTVLAILSLVLFLGTLPGTVGTLRQSQEAAQQQAFWYGLEDEVALVFHLPDDEAFQEATPAVARVVKSAEADGEVALSYGMDAESMNLGERYSWVELSNPRWRELVGENFRGVQWAAKDAAELPAGVRTDVVPQLDLWLSQPTGGVSLPGSWTVAESVGTVPVTAAGGELHYTEGVLGLEVDRVGSTFNADFLSSAASSGNLLFHDAETTSQRLHEAGAPSGVHVVLVAEDGVLRAEMMRYFMILRAAASGSLLLSVTISAVVSAMVSALLAARRDHVLQLAGTSPVSIAARRSLTGWVAIGAVLALVLALGRGNSWLPLLTAALLLAGVLFVAHWRAVSWVFARTTERKW